MFYIPLVRSPQIVSKYLNRGRISVSPRLCIGFLNNHRLYSADKKGIEYPAKKEKIHSFEECHTPNLMSTVPPPAKNFEKEYNKIRNRNLKVFFAGLAAFATALGLYYASVSFEREPKKPAAYVKTKRKSKRIVPKYPEVSATIPKKVPYLIIGGGTSAFSAFRAIKSCDPYAQILMVSNEPYLPYMRPPLSKEMWFNPDKNKVEKLMFRQWNGTERSLLYEPFEFYTPVEELNDKENGGVSVITGYEVKSIDPYCKKAKLNNGHEISYDKCLIATGAEPRSLPIFESAGADPEIKEKIKVFRNIYDFEDLQETFNHSINITVIGGGFLGSELSCALARLARTSNKKVYQIFKEQGNLGKILPAYLSRWTTEKVTKEGVEVIPNAEVLSCKLDPKEKMLHLQLSNGQLVKTDTVVICVGVQPNTNLGKTAGLEVDPVLGGYLVNAELNARTDLFVAGDAACFYDPKFGRRRLEHHDHAVVTGRLAGENMTGQHKPYIHQSMFWSDLGPDVGFEAIGVVDSSLPTVGVFAKASSNDKPESYITETDSDAVRTRVESTPASCDGHISKDERIEIELSSKAKKADIPVGENPEEFGKGIIFYLRDNKVVGIVLWNVFNRIQIARQILKEDKTYEDLNEVAKLFNIHEE